MFSHIVFLMHFLSFLLIYMKITQKVFFVLFCLVAVLLFFNLAGEGVGTILGPFADHYYIIKNKNMKTIKHMFSFICFASWHFCFT